MTTITFETLQCNSTRSIVLKDPDGSGPGKPPHAVRLPPDGGTIYFDNQLAGNRKIKVEFFVAGGPKVPESRIQNFCGPSSGYELVIDDNATETCIITQDEDTYSYMVTDLGGPGQGNEPDHAELDPVIIISPSRAITQPVEPPSTFTVLIPLLTIALAAAAAYFGARSGAARDSDTG